MDKNNKKVKSENQNEQTNDSKIEITERESDISLNKIKKNIRKIENFLQGKIGFYWWKKYIAGAFWSNIATPVNLSITLITAFTTGQAVTNSLLDNTTYSYLSVAALIISTLNTFFSPHNQMMDNISEMKKWNEFGGRFMNIYNDTDENMKQDVFTRKLYKLKEYRLLQKEINEFISQSNVNQNFATDLIHIIARYTCLKGREGWLYYLESNDDGNNNHENNNDENNNDENNNDENNNSEPEISDPSNNSIRMI